MVGPRDRRLRIGASAGVRERGDTRIATAMSRIRRIQADTLAAQSPGSSSAPAKTAATSSSAPPIGPDAVVIAVEVLDARFGLGDQEIVGERR
jgi:hypothetical protein